MTISLSSRSLRKVSALTAVNKINKKSIVYFIITVYIFNIVSLCIDFLLVTGLYKNYCLFIQHSGLYRFYIVSLYLSHYLLFTDFGTVIGITIAGIKDYQYKMKNSKSIEKSNISTMKYKMTSTLWLLLIFCSTALMCNTTMACPKDEADNRNFGDTVRIISSPDLIPLVNAWADSFGELNPAVKISVSPISRQGGSDERVLYIIPQTQNELSPEGLKWSMVIGHNAVVPVISSSNPMLKEIIASGIKPSDFSVLLTGNGKRSWSEIIPGGSDATVRVYLAGDDEMLRSVAGFIGVDQEKLEGISNVKADEIIALIEKDPGSIGFCKLADIRKNGKNELPGNIVLLPIDRNGNGRIDSFEKIYGSPDELTRGIWIGKYPSSLCGSIFAASSEKPSAIDQIAFLKWVLTDGAQTLTSSGYISLAGIERETGLTAIAGLPPDAIGDVSLTGTSAFVIILASIALLITIIIFVTKKIAKARVTEPDRLTTSISGFNENIIISPNGLLFDKSHTWTFMERDGMVRFGVDDFIQHVTGIITGVKLKEPGEFVRRGEKILSIVKDGKQIDLYSPVSGTIRSLNTDLSIDASIINSSPYADGWVYLIEPRNWVREMQLMFMADRYRLWLTEEFTRLKIFLSTITRENSTCAQVIMQDGGELTENVLSDLEPEVWEDFQTRFIDVSR
jgi:glycine cleavage system H lipoate-binding protein/ABC-type phosphate transport system substrate-binding protein